MGRWSVLRVATIGLIVMAVAVVVSAAYLINNGHDVPDGIIALGSAAVGALATLMTTGGTFEEGSGGTITVEKKVDPPGKPV